MDERGMDASSFHRLRVCFSARQCECVCLCLSISMRPYVLRACVCLSISVYMSFKCVPQSVLSMSECAINGTRWKNDYRQSS